MEETATIQTLSKVADTITSKPASFEIIFIPQNKLHAWLIKKKILPGKKTFEIKPIVLGNLLRISKLLLTIQGSKGSDKSLLDQAYNLVRDHTETVVEIIAIAIQNNKYEPAAKLKRQIAENLTPKEVLHLVSAVLQQLDLTNFISSIISIRGLNVLDSGEKKEVSPASQGS